MAIDCRMCQDKLVDWLYGELDGPDSAEVARHVEGCQACAARAGEYRATMRALDTLKGAGAPAASAEGARQALEREMLLAGAGKSREPRRLFGFVLAAAAILLAAFVVWWFAVPGNTGGLYAADVEVRHLAYELTVFNDNLALVKDKRHIVNLEKGTNVVRFADVAERMDPTSVRFESMTDPLTTKVLEQNYEFDLATPEALLKKYVDRKIACITKDGRIVEGYLASYELPSEFIPAGQSPAQTDYSEDEDGRVMLRKQVQRGWQPSARSPGSIVLTADKGKGATFIVSVDDLTAVRLEEMPKGLLVKPTLVWNLSTEKPGPHDTNLIYQTSGFSWNADYVVTVGKDDVLDWFGWVTINNNSGTSYPDAKLKLIAGEVHRVQDENGGRYVQEQLAVDGMRQKGEEQDKAFEEKAFFEYHLYTLNEPTTLNNAETKQLKLMKADGVKSTRRYIFDANVNDSNALVELEVWNKKENHMGMPLPKGSVRFLQADPDGELQYIGRDAIEHTSKDEKLELNIGASFDVTGERVLRRESSTNRQSTQSFVITLRNHKTAPVKVVVREHPNSGQQWAVTVKSQEFNKIDQNTIEFPVEIPANGAVEVSYVIRYTW